MIQTSTVSYPTSHKSALFHDLLEDDLDIFGDDEGLFDFRHTPKVTTMPDYVASRKPCEDFEDFESVLKSCQADLKHGKRKIKDFKNEQQIDVGYFFVLNGILVYVAEVEERKLDKSGKMNARLRCIFENGTESDMLLRSLAAELYKNGKRITENHGNVNAALQKSLGAIIEEDKETGFIYVLKSKSSREEIASLDNLYKIGYSRTAVAERIKHAAKKPTYLMAEVEYVAGWKCYNMNTQKFEQLIHNFFGSSCLNIDVFDEKGKRYTPREWFIAPYEVIEKAIALIISGEVVKYRYDVDEERIVGR
ncbi:MAG: GIY-YIG nuclease family protein [Lunatimonas sp.]|uniref:GIY-YIG nuclease family protein n=1 Tax=Lunatimonas sp. TaxID=2060141 RepID=UPI002A4016FE|nr:GIY-YIG nuclease family protein [Lunatimonas sp.]